MLRVLLSESDANKTAGHLGAPGSLCLNKLVEPTNFNDRHLGIFCRGADLGNAAERMGNTLPRCFSTICSTLSSLWDPSEGSSCTISFPLG